MMIQHTKCAEQRLGVRCRALRGCTINVCEFGSFKFTNRKMKRGKFTNPIHRVWIKFYTQRAPDLTDTGDPIQRVCEEMKRRFVSYTNKQVQQQPTKTPELFLINLFQLTDEVSDDDMEFVGFLLRNTSALTQRSNRNANFYIQNFVRIFIRFSLQFRMALFKGEYESPIFDSKKLDIIELSYMMPHNIEEDMMILQKHMLSIMPTCVLVANCFNVEKLHTFDTNLLMNSLITLSKTENNELKIALFEMVVRYSAFVCELVNREEHCFQSEIDILISFLKIVLKSPDSFLESISKNNLFTFVRQCLCNLTYMKYFDVYKDNNELWISLLSVLKRISILNDDLKKMFLNEKNNVRFFYNLFCKFDSLDFETVKTHEVISNFKHEKSTFDYNFRKGKTIPVSLKYNGLSTDFNKNEIKFEQLSKELLDTFIIIFNEVNSSEYANNVLEFAMNYVNEENVTENDILKIIYFVCYLFNNIKNDDFQIILDFPQKIKFLFNQTIFNDSNENVEKEIYYTTRNEIYKFLILLFSKESLKFNIYVLGMLSSSIKGNIYITKEILNLFLFLYNQNKDCFYKYISCAFIENLSFSCFSFDEPSNELNSYFKLISTLLSSKTIIEIFFINYEFLENLFFKLFDECISEMIFALIQNTFCKVREKNVIIVFFEVVIKIVSHFQNTEDWNNIISKLEKIFDILVLNNHRCFVDIFIDKSYINNLIEILNTPINNECLYFILHIITSLMNCSEKLKYELSSKGLNFFQRSFESYSNFKDTKQNIQLLTNMIFERDVEINDNTDLTICNPDAICLVHFLTISNGLHQKLFDFFTKVVNNKFYNQLTIYNSDFYTFANQYIFDNPVSEITSSFIGVLNPMFLWNIPPLVFDHFVESKSTEQVQMIIKNVLTSQSYEFPKAFVFSNEPESGIFVSNISPNLLNEPYSITMAFYIDAFIHPNQTLFEFKSEKGNIFSLLFNRGVLQLHENNKIIAESKMQIQTQKWYNMSMSIIHKNPLICINGMIAIKDPEIQLLDFPNGNVQTVFGHHLIGMVASVYMLKHYFFEKDLLNVSNIEPRLTLMMDFGPEAQLPIRFVPFSYSNQNPNDTVNSKTSSINVKGYILKDAINIFRILIELNGLANLIKQVNTTDSFLFILLIIVKIMKIQPKLEKKLFMEKPINLFIQTLFKIEPSVYTKETIPSMIQLIDSFQNEENKSIYFTEYLTNISKWKSINADFYDELVDKFMCILLKKYKNYLNLFNLENILYLIFKEEREYYRMKLWEIYSILLNANCNINNLNYFLDVTLALCNDDTIILEASDFLLFRINDTKIITDFFSSKTDKLFKCFYSTLYKPEFKEKCLKLFEPQKMIELKSKYTLHQTFLTTFIFLCDYMPKNDLYDFLNHIRDEYENKNLQILEPFHSNPYTFYLCTFLFINYYGNFCVNSFLKIIFLTNLSILDEFIFTFMITSRYYKIDLKKQFIQLMMELSHELLSEKSIFQFLQIVTKLIFISLKMPDDLIYNNENQGTCTQIINSLNIKNITISWSNAMNYYDIGINMISILLKMANLESEKDLIVFLVCKLIKVNPKNMDIPISVLPKLVLNSNHIDFIKDELKETTIDCCFLYLFPINFKDGHNMRIFVEETFKKWGNEIMILRDSIHEKLNMINM